MALTQLVVSAVLGLIGPGAHWLDARLATQPPALTYWYGLLAVILNVLLVGFLVARPQVRGTQAA